MTRPDPEVKQALRVKEIFSTVPGRYDFLNHLLSGGRDIYWRNFTVEKMVFGKTGRLLDIATGTADLAVAAARRWPEIEVVGVDFVSEMMALGKKKIINRRLEGRISLLQGDALSLPFPDNSFDVAAMAFGIRNIEDKPRALEEMTRVVVPGGQVLVLEMGFPERPLGRLFFYPYLNYILPHAARCFSKNPAAYRYLADSILNFPSPPTFMKIMTAAGLTEVKVFPLTLGITCLYLGYK